MMNESLSAMERLPPELLAHILSFIEPRELAACARVHSLWRGMAVEVLKQEVPLALTSSFALLAKVIEPIRDSRLSNLLDQLKDRNRVKVEKRRKESSAASWVKQWAKEKADLSLFVRALSLSALKRLQSLTVGNSLKENSLEENASNQPHLLSSLLQKYKPLSLAIDPSTLEPTANNGRYQSRHTRDLIFSQMRQELTEKSYFNAAQDISDRISDLDFRVESVNAMKKAMLQSLLHLEKRQDYRQLTLAIQLIASAFYRKTFAGKYWSLAAKDGHFKSAFQLALLLNAAEKDRALEQILKEVVSSLEVIQSNLSWLELAMQAIDNREKRAFWRDKLSPYFPPLSAATESGNNNI